MPLAATARLCAQEWFKQTALKIRALVVVPPFAYCINQRVVDRRVPTDRSSVRAISARIWTANVVHKPKEHLWAPVNRRAFSELERQHLSLSQHKSPGGRPGLQ